MADEIKAPEKKEKEQLSLKPERGAFVGDRMNKWAEEMNLFKEEDSKKEAKPEKSDSKEAAKKEAKPCETCPDDEKSKEEQKKGKKEEPKKPIKTFTIGGKTFEINSQEELNALAKELNFSPQKEEWEKSLESREDNLSKISVPLAKLVEYIERGGVSNERKEETLKKEELESDEFEDVHPAVKEVLKRQREDIETLKKENVSYKGQQQQQFLNALVQELDKDLDEARNQSPFDELIDKESGENISQKMFAGLISVFVNDDKLKMIQDPKFKMRPLKDYVNKAASTISKFQKIIKSASINSEEKITSSFISEKFPEITKEIGEQAIVTYLKTQEQTPPSLKSSPEISADLGIKKRKGKFKNLDDALKSGLEDPGIASAIEEAGKRVGLP